MMAMFIQHKDNLTMRMRKSAFTLIEISIVLIIIGLLIGGILVGRNLIRNAEIQSVVSDIGNFKIALKQFYDKYKYMPGDFPNAEAIWGSQCGSVNTDSTTLTCNGNGDGHIDTIIISSILGVSYESNLENAYAWKHLMNAGMINISYDPVGFGRATGRIANSIYSLFYAPPTNSASAPQVFTSRYGHVIVFGASISEVTAPASGAAITGSEALSIDQIMDDAKPGTGIVMSYTNHATSPTRSCASSSTQSSAIYNVSSGNTKNCSLIFLTGF